MGKSTGASDRFRGELKAERTRRGLSQEQLAAILVDQYGLGAHATTIAKIESGERDVRINELDAFADLFGISTDALLVRNSAGGDVVWAASKLTSNAQKAIAELLSLRQRIARDVEDLTGYADRDRRRPAVQGLLDTAGQLNAVLIAAGDISESLAGEFPLPGMKLGK